MLVLDVFIVAGGIDRAGSGVATIEPFAEINQAAAIGAKGE